MTFGIGELARSSGCGIETIRYYERSGLIPHAARRGRNRCYGAEDVTRLRFIRTARALGFSTAEISLLLGVMAGARPCGEARAVAAINIARLDGQVQQLTAMIDWLNRTIADCQPDNADDCHLVVAMADNPASAQAAG